MNDKLGLVTLILIAALSVAGCGNEEKVHESWKAPPAKEEVDDSTLASTVKASIASRSRGEASGYQGGSRQRNGDAERDGGQPGPDGPREHAHLDGGGHQEGGQ